MADWDAGPRPPSGGLVRRAVLKGDKPVDGVLLARPGDQITCSEGHPVFDVVENMYSGNQVKSRWVRRLDGTQPVPGEQLPRTCDRCGAELFPLLCVEPRRYGLFINGKLVGED